MSKLIQRASAVFLATAMMAGVLAGCGGSKKEEPSNTKAASTAADANPMAQKVKIIHYIQDRNTVTPADEEVLKYLNDKFNIDYARNNVPTAQFKEKVSLLIASGEAWDLLTHYSRFGTEPFAFNSLVQNKMVMPLDELLNKYGQNLLKESEKVYKDAWPLSKGPDGKIYAMPFLGFTQKAFLLTRIDWMKKLGIENPKTIEDFEKMLMTFRDKDPDGNGKNDTYPMVSFFNVSSLPSPYSYLDWTILPAFVPTGPKDFVDKDGNLVPSFMHPGYKQYLATLQKWYKEKLIHPDYFVLKQNQATELIAKEVAGVYPAWYTFGGNELSKSKGIKSYEVPEIYNAIPLPKGPSGVTGAHADNVYRGINVISQKTKPEVAQRIVQMLDWMQTKEGAIFNNYGVEGKHCTYNKEKNVVVNKLNAEGNNSIYKQQLLINIGNEWLQPESMLESNTSGKLDLAPSIRQRAFKGEFTTINPASYHMPFDYKGTSVEGNLTDLNEKMPMEMYVKIVSGEKPVDYLDEFIKMWKSKGGDKLIEENTKQYKKFKESMK